MGKHLFFDHEFSYKDEEEGISLPVKLTYGGQTVGATAKVDPGAAVSLFSREVGIDLGIPIEDGFQIIDVSEIVR